VNDLNFAFQDPHISQLDSRYTIERYCEFSGDADSM
jgi:hypothetical protein